MFFFFFFFSSRRRHTSLTCDWSSDVCSSDLTSHVPRLPSDLLLYLACSQPRRDKKWGFTCPRSNVRRSGVLLYTAARAVAVPNRLSSTRPTIHVTSPPADE